MLNRTGKLNDGAVNRFAVRGEYVNVVASLALKADAKPEVIELMLDRERLYGLIVACKAARLSWSTTTMIVRNRPGCPPPTQRELDQCVAIHEALLLSVAQWTIRWGSDQLLGKDAHRIGCGDCRQEGGLTGRLRREAASRPRPRNSIGQPC